jgi:hypothetical protein
MRFTLKALFLAAAAALVLAPKPAMATAFTATLTLTPDKTTAIQQSTQDPCIFGNPPCGQNNDSIGADAGLGHDFLWERTPLSSEDSGSGGPLVVGDHADDITWGNGSGETNDFDPANQRILVGDLEKVLGTDPNDDNFDIGVDVNQAADTAGTYTITQFILEIHDGTTNGIIDSWTFTNGAGTPGGIPAANNGTGWSDAILAFPGLDLDHYLNTDYIIFRTTWTGNTDGADNYFINSAIPGPPNIVPEPASILLLGSGLVSAAGMARRRKAAKAKA